MDYSGYFSFKDADIYEEDGGSLEAQQNYMRLMFTDESYLSEITFVKVLGRGGCGIAVLFRHNTTGTFVVDKISDEDLWIATVAEVQCMTRMSGSKYFLSPVAYFKSSALDRKTHLMMEYFPGPNLLDFLMTRILNFRDVQYILRQLGEAFVQMHSRGIIHVDIKPANILINGSLECKVIDFGLSMSGPEAGGIYGTEVFAAPEVIAHKYDRDAASFGYSCDYYSLGLTCLSMAANLCHPDLLTDLLGTKGQKYLPMAVALQKEINPDGPDDTFYDLITGLIEMDPAKRLNDRTFLSHPFFSKKFKEQSERLSQEVVLRKMKKFDAERYRKKVRRSEAATRFHKRVAEDKNAKVLTVERFAFVLRHIRQKYETQAVKELTKNNMSFWSKLKQALKPKTEKAGRNEDAEK